MAEPFDPSLFVGRQLLLEQIVQWAAVDCPDHQVWSLVGPPGVGKSYLIHKVFEVLDQAAEQLVFWIDLTRDGAIRGDAPDVTRPDGAADWLAQAIIRARRVCSTVRRYDATVPFESMLDTLVDDLCRQCSRVAPILLVDGFDEVTEQQRLDIEERLLAIFARRGCTRVLISRRDENALHSYELRWKERTETIEVLSPEDAQAQLRTRLDHWQKRPNRTGQTGYFQISSELLADLDLFATIRPYAWNHPGLNTLLLERAVIHRVAGQFPLLTKLDVHDCLSEITASNGIPLNPVELRRLAELADTPGLPPEWTEHELHGVLKLTIDDPALKELFDRGIVVNVEKTPRYTIAPGLREIVKAWVQLP
jgi:ABC-type nitrate/sulfonate/bicarbonate transport system ATPase subunit